MYEKIFNKFNEIKNLTNVLSLLNWDQSTYIPLKGINSRCEAVETITKISHEMLIANEFYDQLNTLVDSEEFNKLTNYQQQEIFKIQYDVDKARKIPTSLAQELAKTTSLAMSVWEEAKKNNDDKDFLPLLQTIYALKIEEAHAQGFEKNPYDALLDEYDRGLQYEYVKPLFDNLEKETINLLQKIKSGNEDINDEFLYQKFDSGKQRDFGFKILKDIGIDFDSFRQDMSIHPFTTTIGIGDVRITTNIDEHNFKKGFFSTIHETGHALYEISVGNKLKKSPFANLESLSLHESQSRFYENFIARSFEFWDKYYLELQTVFPDQLKNRDINNFYKAINKVENNLIRIESDEVTYNLHIILRTQIENALINNEINVKNINEIWNEKIKLAFGIYPKSKSEGYLQDVHWSNGLIGYFPTYTIGNLISAQFYYKIKEGIGDSNIIDKSNLICIREWLEKNVYNYGSQLQSMELVQKATGKDLNYKYFVNYITDKFNKIYG